MPLVLRLKKNICNIDFCLSLFMLWASNFYIFMQVFIEKIVFTSLFFCVSLQSINRILPHSEQYSEHKKRFSLTLKKKSGQEKWRHCLNCLLFLKKCCCVCNDVHWKQSFAFLVCFSLLQQPFTCARCMRKHQ